MSAKKHNQQPDLARTPPPEHLSDAGKTKWRELLPMLVADRIVNSIADLDALELYCAAFGWWRHADELIGKDPEQAIHRTRAGYSQTSAWASIRRQSLREMQIWGDRLGLSPAARGNVRKARESAAAAASEEFFTRRIR